MTKKLVLIVALVALLMFTVPAVSAAITVDGNLTDWGLYALSGPSSDWSKNVTWLPKPGVEFVVQDNDNPLWKYPGFYAPGVHIKGVGSSYTFYNEPPGILNSTGTTVSVPWGGDKWDIKAMYFTQDPNNFYLAIVSSMPQGGWFPFGHDDTPGDLAMHFTNVPAAKFGYEYGMKLGLKGTHENYNPGDIVYLPNWMSRGYIRPITADVMESPALPGGGFVGAGQLAYTNAWLDHTDQSGINPQVIEIKIPKADVGMAGKEAHINDFFLNDNCQNDRIKPPNFVPEFPTMAVSVGAILGMIFVIYVMKRKDL